ncbi:hypothetical protein [Seonamhaeicola sp. ML3]|uniref:hypothetical protein n=1 Tax=Seonamhaeicola sp. ML3 TaxID=2937786 RepID=UPI00200F8913|nr:hypothetical protein [Seonamhaeicola sp. ML3]
MFDYLELDYKTKRERELISSIRKPISNGTEISFKPPFSIWLKTYILKLKFYKKKLVLGISTLLLIVVSTIMLLNPIVVKFEAYSIKHKKETMALREKKKQKAFNFLMNSGKRRLQQGRELGAYKEFKLAYAIYPKNSEVNQLIIETLAVLCEKEGSYCKDLDDIMNSGVLFKPL